MKKLILLFITIFFVVNTYAQKDTIYVADIYDDVSTNLVTEKILIFDSISKKDLMITFENWAGKNFRNYSEVKTSQTDDQISLLFIDNTYGYCSYNGMYIIMLVEFKDNKVRIRTYDDGNVSFVLGNTIVQERTYYHKNFFHKKYIIYTNNTSFFNYLGRFATSSKLYKKNIYNMIDDINNNLKTETRKKEW